MEEYLREKTDQNGRIKLDDLNFTFSSEEIRKGSYFAKNWITLFNGEDYLVKSILKENMIGGKRRDREIEEYEYNTLLVPEILNMLGIESAKYFLATYKGERVIITPSFLKKGETFLDGIDIMIDSNSTKEMLSMDNIIQTLQMWGFSNKIIDDFILQSLASRFVEQTDERSVNWGIIYNKEYNGYKLAPMYDFEYTCDMPDLKRERYVIVDGRPDSTMLGFLNHFKDNPKVFDFLYNIILNFNLEEAIERVKENTGASIDEELKNKYRLFFEKKMKEVKKILTTIIDEKNKYNNIDL